jgi:hypothetical protein
MAEIIYELFEDEKGRWDIEKIRDFLGDVKPNRKPMTVREMARIIFKEVTGKDVGADPDFFPDYFNNTWGPRVESIMEYGEYPYGSSWVLAGLGIDGLNVYKKLRKDYYLVP